MTLRAHFDPGESPWAVRLLFEDLGQLPNPYRYSVRGVLAPRGDENTQDVVNIKTGKVVKILIDKASFLSKLHLSEWPQNIPKSVQLFADVYKRLEDAAKIAAIYQKVFNFKHFVPKEQMDEMAGSITSSLLGSKPIHAKSKDSALPVGYYSFARENAEYNLVFVNVKGSKLLGKGGTRVYKPCLNLFPPMLCAKGIVKGVSSKNIQQEVEVLFELHDQPGIIKTYGAGENTLGNYVFFQRYFEMNLDTAICDQQRPLSETDRLLIVEQMLRALIIVAKRGVHFDIKPENILWNRSGEAVITDFGLFRRFGSIVSIDFSKTFLPAPEWGKGEPLSVKYDVWRMGIVFCMLYVGAYPPGMYLRGEDLKKFLLSLKTGWLKLPDSVPEKIRALIQKMTEPDPEKRPTASQALRLLKEETKKSAPEEKKE